jgi:hypothetical protein
MAEKLYDGLAALAKVSGLSRTEVEGIWSDVKKNESALRSCRGPHQFNKEGEGPGATFRCRLCKGTIKAQSRHWYAIGLEHGRRS